MDASKTNTKHGSNAVDMLHGPLLGKIILFALPLMASSILQQLFNSADTAVVGRFASSQAMAAVGSTASLVNLIVSLFVGLSVGANVLISSLIGSGRHREISEAIHTALVVAAASGLLLLVVGIVICRPLLHLINCPDDVIDLATLYLRIYFLGMPSIMIYNYGSAILRSMGDSKRPLIALSIAGVLNVILNMILVIVFHLHVIGVGSATVFSTTVSAALILYFLSKEEEPFRVSFRKLRIQRRHLSQVIRIGIPAGLQGMLFSLSNMVIQSAINGFGSAAAAGSSAAFAFEVFGWFAINAFTQASVTFTSQNYAGGQYDRCKKIYRICLLSGLVAGLFFDLTFLFSQDIVLQIFTVDPAVLAFAKTRFAIIMPFRWLVALYEISGSTMRGMGYSLTPTILMVFGTCLFRILWVALIFPRFGTIDWLFCVYPVSWVVTSILVVGTYYYVRRRAFRRVVAER